MNELSLGQKAADWFAARLGSWSVIITQSILILAWTVANVLKLVSFDPYPFILLNLALSLQAAYTGPILLMSANRQAEIDRANFRADLMADIETNSKIKDLEAKVDSLNDKLNTTLFLLEYMKDKVQPNQIDGVSGRVS